MKKIVVFNIERVDVPDAHFRKRKTYPPCTPFRVLHFGANFSTVKACGRGNHREFGINNKNIGMVGFDGDMNNIYAVSLAEYIYAMCP